MTLKEIINRIKCKLFVCCKVTCNETLEKLENDIEEESKHYDYYSNKVKNFNNKKTRSSSV